MVHCFISVNLKNADSFTFDNNHQPFQLSDALTNAIQPSHKANLQRHVLTLSSCTGVVYVCVVFCISTACVL